MQQLGKKLKMLRKNKGMTQEQLSEVLAVSSHGTRPLLIAVTQLTPTSQNMLTDELLIDEKMEDVVVSYAKNAGSDYIVVGRPITQAEDPVGAYRRCKREFCG